MVTLPTLYNLGETGINDWTVHQTPLVPSCKQLYSNQDTDYIAAGLSFFSLIFRS